MKKKITLALIIGFVSLITGLILAGLGFFSGGFHQLLDLSKLEKKHLTFDQIDSLHLQTYTYSYEIEESPDGKVHVTYPNSKNSLNDLVQVHEKDGLLTFSSQRRNPSIKGIMQFLGEQFSYRYGENNVISIQLPKGKTLKKLSSQSSYWLSHFSIQQQTIDEIQVEGSLSLQEVTINKGTITVTNTAYIQDSNLKNVTIAGSNYNLDLVNSKLEKATIEGYAQVNSQKLTLIGENKLSPAKESSLKVTNLDLSDQSLADTSLAITNTLDFVRLSKHLGYYYSESNNEAEVMKGLEENGSLSFVQEQAEHIGIFTRDKYDTLPVTSEKDKHSLMVEKKNSQNKLIIDTVNGTINFVESK